MKLTDLTGKEAQKIKDENRCGRCWSELKVLRQENGNYKVFCPLCGSSSLMKREEVEQMIKENNFFEQNVAQMAGEKKKLSDKEISNLINKMWN